MIIYCDYYSLTLSHFILLSFYKSNKALEGMCNSDFAMAVLGCFMSLLITSLDHSNAWPLMVYVFIEDEDKEMVRGNRSYDTYTDRN